MAINAQQKGKRAERELCKILQETIDSVGRLFPDVELPRVERNLMQSAVGGYDLNSLDWLALEVKHCEQLSINTWWSQAVRQAGKDQLPVLAYKVSRKGWHVVTWVAMPVGAELHQVRATMSLEDFLNYVRTRMIHDINRQANEQGVTSA